LNITYVNRRFLDYRVPVLAALDNLIEGRLQVIFSADVMPERVQSKLRSLLGERAIGMVGEKSCGVPSDAETTIMANAGVAIRYQPGLYRKIGSTHPDVIIGEGFFKWSVAALAHKLTRRTPLVICYERTAHTERNAQWYRRMYRKIVLRAVDAVCCSGSQCAEYTMSLGVPARRIMVGHMAADTEALSRQAGSFTQAEIDAQRNTWNTSGVVFIYVGQMIARKGVSELLAGWKMFENKHPGTATLVLVGDGPERSKLESCRDKWTLRNVHFAGAIDYDSIAICYASADAFIIPTLEDNWSLVVPEAMACGMPVLSSRYNGCWPELVHEDRNGWVFDPLDPEDILKAISRAVEHKIALADMGRRSREIVSRFTPEHAARSMLDACTSALGRQPRHG